MSDAATTAARKRHAIFLGVSAVVVVAVLVFAHSVLLPFVIALVIAYLLTPLVAWVEKRRVRRVKLEIVQTDGEEAANEPNRAHSGA